MVKGGLKLKREVAASTPVKPIGNLIVAEVWVDASVYHLDSEFSYLIPGNLASVITVGSFVSVPFHGREIIGVVVALSELENRTGLKSISKAVGTVPLLSEKTISLVRSACQRYACHPFDIIRSAVPDRVAGAERSFSHEITEEEIVNEVATRSYLQLPPVTPRSTLLAQKISQLLKSGAVLVVLPDLREVQSLSIELKVAGIEYVEIGSHLTKAENYLNFLKSRSGNTRLVIGTRSAIFAPLYNLSTIVIYNEGSEHLYERRTPGWNVRDISLLRSQLEKVSLIFAGYSPSVEIARLIDEKWVTYQKSKAKTAVLTIPSVNGELLPSRALTPIKKSLSSGPVLFLVPLKGYAQAIRCQKCRTVSRCACGGAHEKLSANAAITCNHCSLTFDNWKCVWCNGEVPSLLSRGIERHHLEIGKLFPQVKIQISSSDHPISDVVSDGAVIATPGLAPLSLSGFSAVVILEGNRFLNQPDMRSSERIREMYFAHAALARSGAPIILVQDDGDQISTALSTWNPSIALHRDLEERKNLALPPYVRSAHLTLETSEVTRFKNALLTALEEGRLPQSTRILGPIQAGDKSALILTVSVVDGESLLSTLHEFMRRRSAAKKTLPALRIDPYSLSR
jgi:primosomal protein N' (replication factor Y)